MTLGFNSSVVVIISSHKYPDAITIIVKLTEIFSIFLVMIDTAITKLHERLKHAELYKNYTED
uniref:Uncharacterized protein n=1 Tax=Romanomermis culicivorax TaxID=13658 RepID=A0A915KL59_ROMCU